MPVFLLIIAGLLPILATTGFYFLDNKTAFKKLNNILKQIIIGVVYGGLAILATEVLSSDVGQGTLLNVRDAAPLTCGLAFGAPAGIIAGVLAAARGRSPFYGAAARIPL